MAKDIELEKKQALVKFLKIEDELKEQAKEELIDGAREYWNGLNPVDMAEILGVDPEEIDSSVTDNQSDEFYLDIAVGMVNANNEEEAINQRFEDLLNEAIDTKRGGFSYGKEEYEVYTDDEADEAFQNQQESLWDDLGIGSFSEDFRDEIMRDCIDNESYFKDLSSDVESWIEESPDSYSSFFDIDEMKQSIIDSIKKGNKDKYLDYLLIDVDDYTDEEGNYDDTAFMDAVIEEVEDKDNDEIIDLVNRVGSISDFSSDAASNYIKQYDTAYDFLEELYGKDSEDITKALESYIDKDEIFALVKKYDGRGPTLAGYDGEENEEGDYYIYRTN
jgi:hypothetical protein